jgi:hypothetical protein
MDVNLSLTLLETRRGPSKMPGEGKLAGQMLFLPADFRLDKRQRNQAIARRMKNPPDIEIVSSMHVEKMPSAQRCALTNGCSRNDGFFTSWA